MESKMAAKKNVDTENTDIQTEVNTDEQDHNELYQRIEDTSPAGEGIVGASLGEAEGEQKRIEPEEDHRDADDFKADPERAKEVARENPKVVNESDPESRADENVGGRAASDRAKDVTDPLFGDESKLNFNVRTFFSDLAELDGKVWLEFHDSIRGIGEATEKLYGRVAAATAISLDELEARYEVRTKPAPSSAEQSGYISAFCRRV